jgi:hypothetical protein
MFRFTTRDMLWLTVLVGLALVWRLENRKRQSGLEILNRSEAVADNPALLGEWEIVETILNGKADDFDGKPGGWMRFRDYGEDRVWSQDNSRDRRDFEGKYTIVGPGKIDIDVTGVPGFAPSIWQLRYQLKGGRLHLIRSNRPGERPKDFDAINDPGLTLYVLKKPVVDSVATNADEPDPRLKAVKQKMRPWVGKNVTLTGTLHSGKIAEFVAIDDGGSVHLKAATAEGIAKKVELGRLIGKRVSVTGTLQYSENTPPLRPDVSGIPEHFYIDIAQATIRKAGQER